MEIYHNENVCAQCCTYCTQNVLLMMLCYMESKTRSITALRVHFGGLETVHLCVLRAATSFI